MQVRYYLIALACTLGLALSAQRSIKITGSLVDQVSRQPIEYATVGVYAAADTSLLTGVATDAAGTFSLSTEPLQQPVIIAAQFLGYQTYYSAPLSLSRSTDLGEIGLSSAAALLEAVEVTGKKRTDIHRIDKQTFDAGQFQNARGGTAADILRNLPAVAVDAGGTISVRGATGFLVLIDGKPVQTDPAVVLAQLPANAIESVELITAPSAKYDPDGNAGILNIKTRKGSRDGWYLLANLGGGLPSIEPYDNVETQQRYGADLTGSYRAGKWEVGFGLDYRRDDNSGRRIGYVNTYQDEVLTEFPSFGERSFDRENYSGRLAISHRFTERQALEASFYAGKRTQYRTADIRYQDQQRTLLAAGSFLGPEAYWQRYEATGRVYDGGEVLTRNTYYNENLRVRRGDFLIGALNYALTFADASSLKLSGLYERTILGGPTDNISLDWPNTSDTLQLQFNDNYNPLDGVRLQLDYERPLGKGRWESGYQFRFVHHPGDFIYEDRDLAANRWITNSEFTNAIALDRSIHSLYSQLTGSWQQWQYTAGLRLEYFDRQVGLQSPDTLYRLARFNLFPSVNLKYQFNEQLFAKGGYSRRIDRTSTFELTPFPEREHSETLEQGDAELLPEMTDLLEAGLVFSWRNNSAFATAYYRRVANVINRVNTVYNDTILNRIYTNAGQARVPGLEAGLTIYPLKDWRLYLGANVYRYGIRGQLFGDDIRTANTIYSINATTDLNFTETLALQLGINYLSEQVTAQGRDSRFFSPNLSLRKQLAQRRLSLLLQWQHIDLGLWQANEQRITTVRDNFYTTTNYVYEVDVVRLSLSYQFTRQKKDVKLLKSEFGDQEF